MQGQRFIILTSSFNKRRLWSVDSNRTICPRYSTRRAVHARNIYHNSDHSQDYMRQYILENLLNTQAKPRKLVVLANKGIVKHLYYG